MAKTTKITGIVWFRQDLRLSDNPALVQACKECDFVLPLFIDDPLNETISQLGDASRVWLHHSLIALNASLKKKETELITAHGESLFILKELIQATGATKIYWNRCYDPVTINRDTAIKKALSDLNPRTFNGLLVQEPWENLKSDGNPYKVYTPYWKNAALRIDNDPALLTPLKTPGTVPARPKFNKKICGSIRTIKNLSLLPSIAWHSPMMEHWNVGEQASKERLRKFCSADVHDYKEARNVPGIPGTSRLSPHLHFGEISPRQALHSLRKGRTFEELSAGELVFAKEIVWREFAYSLIYHFPQMPTEPLDTRFQRFPWATKSVGHLVAWQQGRTGVPIVDAGMRELYATGWMHNRVRMIVGSYLVKNLLIPWQSGERWFRDTLIDADMASNAMGWQWVSGCGADAAPFFRVFNPVLQGEKFDPEGAYVTLWVPELAEVDPKFIHKPWELDPMSRQWIDYPDPLVDLKETRLRALDAFALIKGTK